MSTSTPQSATAVARLADLAFPGKVHLGDLAMEPLRRVSSGVTCIDTLLGGGWPQGRIGELFGPPSSGKTSLALTLLATATCRGEAVACVDVADALHPASLAAAGAELQRVLWVRPPSPTDGVRCTELLLQAGGFALVVLDLGMRPLRRLRGHVWPRLLHGAERSHTALVVLASQRLAGSFAALSLRIQPRAVRWQRGLWPLFDGVDTTVLLARNKLGPPGGRTHLRVGHSVLPMCPVWTSETPPTSILPRKGGGSREAARSWAGERGAVAISQGRQVRGAASFPPRGGRAGWGDG